ncbi:MAG TPA: phosphate regulon sensor histidine kinase PhoR [Rhodocyclaceae bacterium]|nr:phosphate regulon sensor histidine kinase PhoR [Rhodocyclaceae bacterium]
MIWADLLVLALLLLLVALAAWFFAGTAWALWAVFGASLLILAVNLRQLAKLKRWATGPLDTPAPGAGGAWGDAFAALHKRARLAGEQREQLNAALNRFRQAAESMPDGVVILDRDSAIEWLNARAESYLGLDNGRDAGANILNLVREPEFAAYLQGRDFTTPLLLRPMRNPGHALRLQVVPFAEARVMLLARDVTQLDKLETMRRDFVANVSHELKTPLTVVGGFIETLADNLRQTPPEEAEHYLQLAREQAVRMQRLIEDLLILSALETDAPPEDEPVDVATLLAQVKDEAVALSGGRHEIAVEMAGPATVRGNGDELRSAFGNLTSNAVRYTPAGGRIVLSWTMEPEGGAGFAVADNGIGIEARHLPRLTERFYRVDRGRSRESGGTGLGLAIVKHVLERHGARLAIDSEPGRGSRFAVLFPARRVANV